MDYKNELWVFELRTVRILWFVVIPLPEWKFVLGQRQTHYLVLNQIYLRISPL